MSAEKFYWGDAEINLDPKVQGKKLEPRPQPLPVEQEEFFPAKLTTAWLETQLPKAVWKDNRSKLTPPMIKLTSDLALKGLSKRAIMARIGMNVQTWGNWERRAAQGEQPYALWYQCVMFSYSGVEERALARIERHGVEDWKADAWRLKMLNPDEYTERKAGTTVNIQGDTENKVVINRIDTDEARKILALMEQVRALPVGTDNVTDAEIVEGGE